MTRIIRAIIPFQKEKRVEEAERKDWKRFLKQNIDQVTREIIESSKELRCVICQDHSPNFSGKAGYAIHLKVKSHIDSTLNYFIENLLRRVNRI